MLVCGNNKKPQFDTRVSWAESSFRLTLLPSEEVRVQILERIKVQSLTVADSVDFKKRILDGAVAWERRLQSNSKRWHVSTKS